MAITPKQQRFIEEYLVDLNATQAAIRAGYAKNTSAEIGYENLRKPQIADSIAEARAKLSQRTEITQDMVMAEFARIGFSDLRKLVNEDGSLKPLSDLTAGEAAAIASIEVVTKTIPGVDGAADVEYIHKIRTWDKVGALTQMGRRLGMFTDKTEHSGSINLTTTLDELANKVFGG